MGKKKAKGGPRGPRFPLEAKAQALALLERGDVTHEQLAADLGIGIVTLNRWRKQLADIEAEKPITKAERAKLKKLERENSRLQEEIEILKKAHTFWAKHRS
jgi:transposase